MADSVDERVDEWDAATLEVTGIANGQGEPMKECRGFINCLALYVLSTSHSLVRGGREPATQPPVPFAAYWFLLREVLP